MSDDIQTVRWFLDKRDDRTAWAALDRIESQNQALQERIEELEGILRAWRIDVPRPTQETDPPRDKVFDQARVLAGLPPKPPQETDPDAVNGG
jgi:hypothetical protein